MAGTAALLVAANPDASVDELRDVLTDTAKALGSANHYGYGLVQPVPALTAIRELASIPTGTVTGTVTEADSVADDPIEDATVSGRGDRPLGRDGRDEGYTIEEVPVGTYDVTATADGYDSETKEVAVEDGESVEVDLALTPTSPPPSNVTRAGHGTSRGPPVATARSPSPSPTTVPVATSRP